MKKPRPSRPKAIKDRAAQTAAVITPASPVAAEAPKRKMGNPFRLFTETRAEARKITWTTWKETWITSMMVFIMCVMAATFFFGLDKVLSIATAALLQFSSAGA